MSVLRTDDCLIFNGSYIVSTTTALNALRTYVYSLILYEYAVKSYVLPCFHFHTLKFLRIFMHEI